MGIFRRLKESLSFTEWPVTILTVIIYAVIFASLYVTDEPVEVPLNQQGLNITTAWHDLHQIAARPHPYGVRANDDVRAFILSRVQAIALTHPHITIDDDTLTNVSFSSGLASTGSGSAAYFEGTNILVKVDGSDPELSLAQGAVLFDAHYDSVSTAPGATDDGMGVASLIALLEYLAKNRLRRTAVFNINNGEEDGLFGAHAFMEHPWAKLCTTFLNLEGAASGGRPLVFRASYLSAAAAFAAAHPHISVLTGDAYARGAVRSFTDYQVYLRGNGTASADPSDPTYNSGGMEGIDLAFYQGRAKYHTKHDAIAHISGGRRALWAMMSSTRDTALVLLNTTRSEKYRNEPAVYYDLLGWTTFAYKLRTLLVVEVALLILGPVIIIALVVSTIFRARKARERAGRPAVKSSAKDLFLVLLGWARFWIALGVAVASLFVLSVLYTRVNPYVVHSYAGVVLATTLSLAYLAIVLPLSVHKLPFMKATAPGSARQRKLATLLESYALAWALLLAGTMVSARMNVGGTYWIAAWNFSLLIGTLLALFEAWLRAGRAGGRSDLGAVEHRDHHGVAEEEARTYLVRGVRFETDGTDTGALDAEGNPVRVEGVIETEPTEITPLIAQQEGSRSRSPSRRGRSRSAHGHANGNDHDHENGDADDYDSNTGKEAGGEKTELVWWIFQLLSVVPIPALLVLQLATLLLAASSQTLVDGNSPLSVYAIASVFSLFAILPIAPFAHKMHRGLTTVVALLFIGGAFVTMTAFPFTEASPMKAYFVQTLELRSGNGTSSNGTYESGPISVPGTGMGMGRVMPMTSLSAVQPYLADTIVPELPSSWGVPVNCSAEDIGRGPGLTSCSWASALVPAPGRVFTNTTATTGSQVTPYTKPSPPKTPKGPTPPSTQTQWLKWNATRTNATAIRIELSGTNVRTCRIRFESRPISSFRILGADEGLSRAPGIPGDGTRTGVPRTGGGGGGMRVGYEIPAEGIRELKLWGRTFGRTFVVDAAWSPASGDTEGVRGRVSCMWNEHESGAAGGASRAGGRIPAYEEALAGFPRWALPTKRQEGLVEVWEQFEV